MRHLITEQTGFIGRLCRKTLRYSNNEIFAVDLSLDKLAPQSKLRITRLYFDGKQLPTVDCVVHAAALLGVDFVEKNPLRTVLDNISMFRPLVKYAGDDGPRFVFFFH